MISCFISIYLFGCTRSYLQHMRSSSLTRDQTQALCIKALSLNHWTTREVLMTGCFRFLPYYGVNTQPFLWVISLSLFQGSWWDWQSRLSCLPPPPRMSTKLRPPQSESFPTTDIWTTMESHLFPQFSLTLDQHKPGVASWPTSPVAWKKSIFYRREKANK